MNRESMGPHGRALLAYFEGDTSAELILRRDDGLASPLPVRHFFRGPGEFSPLERTALDACRGRILDIGAGSGLHSLELVARGHDVVAIDICPEAVHVMRRRGLVDAHCADVLSFDGGVFDTLFLLGHGIGMAETRSGLAGFLEGLCRSAAADGQVLLDSLDVRATGDPVHRAYHETNRKAGRYEGDVRLQIEYAGDAGPFCGWLHVDPDTLAEEARRAGWDTGVLSRTEAGEYLARLQRR